ncbi:MAG: lysylphosphatidylglycerol synthase transmembrane domain-containing protein, partial [Candidatus Latescibacteria bacterium]|nr:lysylphosphatidylglycerol synthase transmembrane domain-containing protein [Candidatus Latescibacterota bacterium]
MRRALLIVLGLVISGVFVAIAVKEMDWPKVAETIRRMDPMPWLPLSVLAYLVGQFVRGVRCRLLVSHEANISTMTGSNIVIIGYAVNTVLPARMGEVARAGVMSERTGLPFIQSLTVTFLERVLDGLAILSVLLVTTLMLPVEGLIKNTVYVASIVLGSAAAGITIAVASPEFLTTLISRTVGVIGRRWHDAALRLSMYVANGVSYLRVPRDAVRVGLLSVLVWVIETVMFLLLFPAFGLPIEFWWAALAMAVTNLGILVPSAPGYVGPFHYFCMMALISVGVDESVALGFAVVVHI